MSTTYADWIGRQESVSDTLDPARSNALRAALGNALMLKNGDALPLLHHWLYFWNVVSPQGLGSDGHPAKGGFLPPIPLPRRMWAGGRLRYVQPLLLGDTASRTSTILSVEEKNGKSGQLIFVKARHELAGSRGLAISEEQDIVYREPASPAPPASADAQAPEPVAQWRESVQPDPVLLFRYSALTMNGHRIHYDRPYAMNEEAYPALVVHGPLQATMLADMAARKLTSPITEFEFRGQAPAFDGAVLNICGDPTENGAKLWTQQGGKPNMVATVKC